MTFLRNVTLVIGLSGITLSTHALAEAPLDFSEPLAIRGIMLQLGEEMQNVTAAITSENWTQVEKSAAWIADHPKPPMAERMRIMGFLGSDAGKFKGSDKKTHNAARALAENAKAKDGQAVISAFATLQSTCLVCHEEFRPAVQQHFYGQ